MRRNKRWVARLPITPTFGIGYTFREQSDIRVEGSIVAETEHYQVLILPIDFGIEVNETPFDTRFDPVTCDDPENCGNLSHQYDALHDSETLVENRVRIAYEQARNARKLSNRLRVGIKNLVSARQKPKSPAQIKAEAEADALAAEKTALAEKIAVASASSKLGEATVVIKNDTISLASPDNKTTYLTVDLSPIVPERWNLRIEHLAGKHTGYFGIVLFQTGHLDEVVAVRSLTNADYREPGTTQCSHTPSSNCENSTSSVYLYHDSEPVGFRIEDTGLLLCERELGHAGNHQTVFKDSYFRWDELRVTNLYYRNDIYSWNGSLRACPVLEFAFKNICPYCGFVSAGSSSGAETCIFCSTWEDRLHGDGEVRGFVIGGNFYFIKTRNFKGETVRIIQSDDSEWSGELSEPITIPDWWRNQFPDNATLVES